MFVCAVEEVASVHPRGVGIINDGPIEQLKLLRTIGYGAYIRGLSSVFNRVVLFLNSVDRKKNKASNKVEIPSERRLKNYSSTGFRRNLIIQEMLDQINRQWTYNVRRKGSRRYN